MRSQLALAGVMAAAAIPVLLCSHGSTWAAAAAAGQCVLWWSLLGGLGLVAAGAVDTAAARRAAGLCVAASVMLDAVCVEVSPRYGLRGAPLD